jgi:serine O-acetyltransferase
MADSLVTDFKNRGGRDAVWSRLREEALIAGRDEPMLAGFVHETVLKHHSLERALSFVLAGRLQSRHLTEASLVCLFDEVLAAFPQIGRSAVKDLEAVALRDPAAGGVATPFLNFKGFQALQTHRIAHALWKSGRELVALHLQSRSAEVFSVDIHPAATMGHGILMDHGTGIVIGETAVVEDDVSMLHEVTLGGSGKRHGDRHPKIGRGVLLGAGAKVLGNVRVGEGAKVAASSVVLEDVPAHCTVAGIPAKVVGHPGSPKPSLQMDQKIEIDYVI